MTSLALWVLHHARRAIILVVGGTIVLIGVALLVLPGPGLLTLALGLAVLGLEFAWAKRLLKRVQQETQRNYERLARVAGIHTTPPE